MRNASILWFTGLSGSGKSTIAGGLVKVLETRKYSSLVLDGDQIRNTLHSNLKFTPDDIKENNRAIVSICEASRAEYDFILVSVISPFRESREYARTQLGPGFSEIYVKADLQECIRRDVKGLYKKALEGMIENFIGISPNTPYEEPLCPDIILDTQKKGISTCIDIILNHIER